MDHSPGGRGEPARQLESRPLYLQARDLLRARIVDGTWPPGHFLPSEMRLAEEFGVSLGTVRKAMEDLVGQGLLERLHGRGTRVVKQSSDQARFRFFRLQRPDGSRFVPVGRVLAVGRRPATREEADLFGLSPRQKVIVVDRERRDGDTVVAGERLILPEPAFRRLDLPVGSDLGEELYVTYQEQCGVTVAATRDEIAAEAADAATARLLGLPEGAPLLRISRHAFGLDGTVVEWRVDRTARLHYRVDLD